jgi:hypothetical protein
MSSPTVVELLGAALFVLAILHTFSTSQFERLAHSRPEHAGVWHLLAEVEVVFGFWAMLLIVGMALLEGQEAATHYLDTRNFTEPMFVFVIMVMAASRPVLRFASYCVRQLASRVPVARMPATYFTALAVVPLLGSFITEPAAMTLAALILRDQFYSKGLSSRLKYATLGALFVNVSIGGTLTPFAAPPVLMVAGTWGWDVPFMIGTFGWRAALAVVVNALAVTAWFRRELGALAPSVDTPSLGLPASVVAVHLAFLTGVVVFAHHPAVFVGQLLFFLGFVSAYPRYQDRLMLREGLLVAFFLSGLVVLGGVQRWWLQPLLMNMTSTSVYFGATALTAVTDNAALTYLGSLVEGLSDQFKYALVAGAVTGGGLTVIANAPNPAGFSILRAYFADEVIHPLGLLAAALPPTVMAIVAFWVL